MAAATVVHSDSVASFGTAPALAAGSESSGDGAMIAVIVNGTTTVTWPSGFTEHANSPVSIGSGSATLYYATDDNLASVPSNYNLSLSASKRYAAAVVVVTDQDGTTMLAEAPTESTGSGTSVDSGASGTLSSDDYLAVVIAGQEGSATTRFTAPSGYTEQEDVGLSGGGFRCGIGVFTKGLTSATSEDPGAATSSVSDDWGTILFMVSPAGGGGTTPVSDTLSIQFDVRATVSDSLSLQHDVRAVASDSLSLQYDVRAAVSDTLQLVHDIRQAVSDTLSLQYDVRAAVADTLSIEYDVRAVVSDTLQIIFDVEASGASVVTGLDVVGALRAMIADRGLTDSTEIVGAILSVTQQADMGAVRALINSGATSTEIVGAINDLAGADGLELAAAVRAWANSGNF